MVGRSHFTSSHYIQWFQGWIDSEVSKPQIGDSKNTQLHSFLLKSWVLRDNSKASRKIPNQKRQRRTPTTSQTSMMEDVLYSLKESPSRLEGHPGYNSSSQLQKTRPSLPKHLDLVFQMPNSLWCRFSETLMPFQVLPSPSHQPDFPMRCCCWDCSLSSAWRFWARLARRPVASFGGAFSSPLPAFHPRAEEDPASCASATAAARCRTPIGRASRRPARTYPLSPHRRFPILRSDLK